jgi:hypothetical protein
MRIRDRPTMRYSPRQDGWVERLIGSIRRECLDHLIIVNADHLRRVLRPMPIIAITIARTWPWKDSPRSRALEATGCVISEPILGGLHHRYRRVPPE